MTPTYGIFPLIGGTMIGLCTHYRTGSDGLKNAIHRAVAWFPSHSLARMDTITSVTFNQVSLSAGSRVILQTPWLQYRGGTETYKIQLKGFTREPGTPATKSEV